jgi:hypothetical protein
VGDEIERLRAKRGDENVTFEQVADHLRDYIGRRAEDSSAVDRLAGFLADVEDIPHDHDKDARRGLG